MGEKRALELYIHIPFCKRKCLYCDFLSAAADEKTIERYTEALLLELKTEAPAYQDFSIRSVFIGGGTPSILSVKQMERIMDCLKENFDLSAGETGTEGTEIAPAGELGTRGTDLAPVGNAPEITIECNPGTLTEEKLRAYKAMGINRLSLGLQSVHKEELRALGRIHDFDNFAENFRAARRAGFTNINVDLMSALPGQKCEDWLYCLEKVTEFGPEHISAYSLIVEEETFFYELYQEDKLSLPTEEEERLMYEQTELFLQKKGYHRYEISNYAKEGFECIHNKGYWQRVDYAGFGLGAASLVNNVRWSNERDLKAYIEAFEKDGSRFVKEERQILSEKEQMEEFMFLGLRLTKGISLEAFEKAFKKKIPEVYGSVIKELEKKELLMYEAESNFLRLTPKGVDVSNYVLSFFLLED